MAPEKTIKYQVLVSGFTVEVMQTADHEAGPMTYEKDAIFDPIADGFTGGVQNIEEFIAEGKIVEIYDGPMMKYKILGKIESLLEDGSPSGQYLEIGSIHDLPAGVLAEEVEKGNAIVVSEENIVATGNAPVTDNAMQTEKERFYMKKLIVSKTMRKVEDKFYHHVRLDDGSEHDLTVEEYEIVMKD